jgi:hypothetical protein
MIDAKKYEDIAEKRSVFYGDVEKALTLVKSFIIRKDLIIYGGMAVDISLKRAGHEGIYADDIVPDYDFMSPNFFDDSNELAMELYEAGLPNVGSIHAIHLTTRKVRVNFIPVADITYIPAPIYDSIPTLRSPDGMRIVHPDYQRLDMHRAFSTPYEKPPGEVITQRTKKDIKRFRLINRYYPILPRHIEKMPKVMKEMKEKEMKEMKEIKEKKVKEKKKVKKGEVTIKMKFLENAVLGGFFAYALLYDVAKEAGLVDDTVVPLSLVESKDILTLSFDAPVNIITDHFEKLVPEIDGKILGYYNRYLDDLHPRVIMIEKDGTTVEVFDNFGRLLPIHSIRGIQVAGVHYVLMYFLLKSFESAGNVDLYRHFYYSLMVMIERAEQNGGPPVFFLTADVYGEKNWSAEYINSLQERFLRKKMRPQFGFYPDKTDKWTSFDPNQNELFLIDGEKRKNGFPTVTKMTGGG